MKVVKKRDLNKAVNEVKGAVRCKKRSAWTFPVAMALPNGEKALSLANWLQERKSIPVSCERGRTHRYNVKTNMRIVEDSERFYMFANHCQKKSMTQPS